MIQPLVYICLYVYPLEPLSQLQPHPAHLGCHRAPGLGSLGHAANSHWLSVLHMVVYMFLCCSAIHHTLPSRQPPPLCPQPILYACSQAFLVLMSLTVWSQVFCRVAFTWDFSGVFPMVGVGFGEKEHRG